MAVSDEDRDIVQRQTSEASKRASKSVGATSGSSGIAGATARAVSSGDKKPKQETDTSSPQAENLRRRVNSALGLLATGNLATDLIRLRVLRETRDVLTGEWAEVDRLLRDLNESKVGGKSILSKILPDEVVDSLLGSWFKSKQKGPVRNQIGDVARDIADLRDEAKRLEGSIQQGGASQGSIAADHTDILKTLTPLGESGGLSDFSSRAQRNTGSSTVAGRPGDPNADAFTRNPPVTGGGADRTLTGGGADGAAEGPSTPVDPTVVSTLPVAGSTAPGGGSTGGGGGAVAGTGSSGAVGAGSSAQGGAGGDGAGPAVQVPGGYQLWQIDGQRIALAYQVPGEDVWLTYDFPDPATLQALFPSGVPAVDVELTSSGVNGVLIDSSGREVAAFVGDGRGVVALENTSTDPFADLERRWDQRAQRNKVYEDPEYLAKLTETILEGRQMTREDLYEVNSIARRPDGSVRDDEEIDRLLYVWTLSDDKYEQAIEQTRNAVRVTLAQAGVDVTDNLEGVIDYMAQRVFSAEWTSEYVTLQANVLSGASKAKLDGGLQQAMQGVDVNSNLNRQQELKREAQRYLGPAISGFLSEQFFSDWAKEIGANPEAKAKFTDSLKGMRLAHFSAYGDDPELTYDEIANPYRSLVFQTWGTQADETDPFFLSLLQGNDMEAAAKALRKKGLDIGNERVTNDTLSSMGKAFGSQVARSF